MGYGFLSHVNELSEQPCDVVVTGADWLAAAPADAMRTLPLADAGMTTRVGTIVSPLVFEWEFARQIDMNYCGLFRTSLWKTGRFRLEAFKTSARTALAFTTRSASGTDRLILPGLYNPRDLRFGGENTLYGQLGAREFLRYPTNIHVVMPLCAVQVLRWTIYGPAYRVTGSSYTTTEPAYRFGLGWVGDGFLFERHVGGSAEGYRRGGKVTELPGGGVSVNPGRGRRTAFVDRAVNAPGERDRFFDIVTFLDSDRPAVWLPDTDSPVDNFRYGGLMQITEDYTQKYLSDLDSASSISLGEVII